jgi:hypothetical protein
MVNLFQGKTLTTASSILISFCTKTFSNSTFAFQLSFGKKLLQFAVANILVATFHFRRADGSLFGKTASSSNAVQLLLANWFWRTVRQKRLVTKSLFFMQTFSSLLF